MRYLEQYHIFEQNRRTAMIMRLDLTLILAQFLGMVVARSIEAIAVEDAEVVLKLADSDPDLESRIHNLKMIGDRVQGGESTKKPAYRWSPDQRC